MNRKTGVILSYVLMAFEVFSTLILTPFIIRSLGQAEYGVYKLALSLNAYLYLLDLGVGNTAIAYISKYRANGDKLSERKFIGISTLFYAVISVLTLVAGLLLTKALPEIFGAGLSGEEVQLAQELLKITVLGTAFVLLTAVYNNALIAYERFFISRSLSILQILLKIIFVFLALKNGSGALGIVKVNFILTLIFRGSATVYAVMRIKIIPKFSGINTGFVKETVKYSSFILFQMIATQINLTADQVLIGATVASSAVIIGVYGVAAQLSQYFQSIGQVFSGVLMPGVVRLVERNGSADEICNEMIKIGRIVLTVCGMVLAVFSVFGKRFINLWAGRANTGAYYVCLLLMTAYLLIMTENVGMQVLYAKNSHKEISVIKLLIVVLNLFVTLLLIKWNPLIGAALGTFIALMLGDVVLTNAVFVKKLKISLMKYWLGVTKGTGICLVFTIVSGFVFSMLTPENWLGLISGCMLTSLTYLTLIWLIGFNEYEKDLLKRVFRQKKKKS